MADFMTEEQVRALLKASTEAGQTKWAEAHGVSRSYVNHVLAGRRAPKEAILRALGIRERIVYEWRRPE